MLKRAGTLLVCLLLAGVAGGQETELDVEKFAGSTMGTVEWHVSIVRPQNAEVADIQNGVQQVLDGLNSRMSTWIPDSEVSRFNNSDSTQWFPVSSDTAKVVARSLEISSMTDGAFDVTVKPLVELWNFGAGRGEFQLPPDELVHEILAHTGYEKLECRLNPPAIRKTEPEIQIDLSGIAKGYSVDLVEQWLVGQGINNWFVDVGGEVSVGGKKLDGTDWRVGIEKPVDDQRLVEYVVSPIDRCMATSGDYRNFAIVDGRRYSHTISPASGRPVEHALASVSVIADDCMTADALATAITVVGPNRLLEISSQFDVEVLALNRNRDGSFREIKTPGFDAYKKPKELNTATSSSQFFSLMLTTLVLVGLAILGLAIGVIFSNKPIKGSCGGLGNIPGVSECQLCKGTDSKCPKKSLAERES